LYGELDNHLGLHSACKWTEQEDLQLDRDGLRRLHDLLQHGLCGAKRTVRGLAPTTSLYGQHFNDHRLHSADKWTEQEDLQLDRHGLRRLHDFL
jgi:hypothetical protein